MEFGGSVREVAAGSWAPDVHISAEHSEDVDAPPKETEAEIAKRKAAKKKSRKSKNLDGLEGTCKICFERPIDMVILPCGHLVVCANCADTVKDLCPLCRQPITSVVKTYHT
jgi:hypothetical protein